MYFWGSNISRRSFFLSADGTLQQMKNSGSIRLVHNQVIVQKIIAYDVTYHAYLRQLEVETELVTYYRSLAAKVFDAKTFQTVSSNNLSYRPSGSPALFDDSPATINEFANRLNYLMGSQFRLNQLLDELNEKATALVTLIKKEYKLK